jgi:hypothetical protein
MIAECVLALVAVVVLAGEDGERSEPPGAGRGGGAPPHTE